MLESRSCVDLELLECMYCGSGGVGLVSINTCVASVLARSAET